MEIVEMIFTIGDKKKRYLITGLINTIFGYFIGILNQFTHIPNQPKQFFII